MDYSPYVIFRENSNNHSVQYITRDQETNKLIPTKALAAALRFESARLAYDFGGDNGLSWWRVGKR